MTVPAARRIANTAIGATTLLLLGSTLLESSGGAVGRDEGDAVYVVGSILGAGIYLWIGRAIVVRQPANTIGWLLLAIPLIASLAFANGDYAALALVGGETSLPFGRAAAWLDRWLLVPMLAAFIPLFLLFPDGRLPSRRWRWVLVVTLAAPVVTSLAFAVTPGRLTGAMEELGPAGVTNPLGIESARGLIETVSLVAGLATLATAVAAAVALVVRFRRATPLVRQQIRWLALVGVAFFCELLLAIVGSAVTDDNDVLGTALFTLMFATLVLGTPIACGVAILRYRLYDLDLVIRKTLIAAILAAFIGLVYVAIVSGIGALIGSESSSALAFVAAAVLAIAFQPARDRARRIADRLVFGRRATPYEVLSQFSERAGGSYSIDEVLPRMAELAGTSVGAERATVWLRVGGELVPTAAWPPGGDLGTPFTIRGDTPLALGHDAVEVRHRGEVLGAIEVSMPPNDPLDPARKRLIGDLAAQAGLVVRNAGLVEELRASRQRLVAAQDEERRRLERNLHDGAQQQLVALRDQLRLAEQLSGTDPDEERLVIHRLQASSAGALDDLRDLARGIYPPLLADQGLAAALEAQARRASIPVEVATSGIGRYERQLEATVYFCALEALDNVAKYANASGAAVRLAQTNGAVTFEVHDDGRGFDPAETGFGTGLQGMADRLDAVGGSLEVRSSPGRGTTVVGTVPIPG
ncbi:MAG: ATP-binding protein [Actinomycetota bacterium]